MLSYAVAAVALEMFVMQILDFYILKTTYEQRNKPLL